MANVNYAELTLAANTVGLLKAKTDLAAVTTAGAKTEAGIKKSMKGVENAVKPVPQAARDAAAGMKDLRMALDPLYASSKKYEAVQKQVAAAVKKGATTQAEANRIMALAEDRYLGMGGAAEVAATRMGNGAGGLAHQSRMAAMQLSQVAQQTAATGNFIQALSIQLPDLALGFGALGIGIGVVAGALLPLAANFVTGGEGAMELSDALDNASSELAEYIDLMSQSDALGADRFERTRGQIELTSQAYSDLIAIAKIEAFNSIEDLNAALVDSAMNARLVSTEMLDVARLLETDIMNASNITIWKQHRAQVRAFKEDLEALRDASSLEEQYAAALQLRDAFKQTVDVNGDLTEEQLAFWKTLSQSIQKMEVMGAAIEAQASGMSKVEQAAAKAAQQYAKSRIEGEKSAAAASELLSQLQQEAKVRSLTLRYGADSVQVANARLEAERRSFVTQVQARDISESLKRELIAAWDAANGAASASSDLSGKLSQASAFAAQLVANLGQVPGAVAAIAGQVDSAINSLQTQNRSLTYQLEQGITASAAAIKAQRDEALKLAAENGATIEQLAALGQSFDEQAAKAEELATANSAMTKTLSDQAAAAGGAGKAMKAAAKEAGRFAKEVERLEFDADPLKKYNAELANLNELAANGLSDGAYAHAVAELNDEFANSDPMISKAGDAIADFVAGGMRDFGDLLGAFKNMLKEMIATAIANPIKLALVGGVSGGGLAGTAAQAAAPGGSGVGTLLQGVGLASGAFGSGVGLGVSSMLGGSFGATFAGQLGAAATGSMTAIAGAAGMAVPVLVAAAAAISFFSSKTKHLDNGLRVTADAVESMVQEFDEIQTKRFWGLSKKVSKNYRDADAAIADPILDAIGKIRSNVLGLGEVLGLAAENFASFNADIEISTKGISEEQAQERLGYALNDIADAMAGAALGWFDVNLIEGVRREGDSWMSALENLAAAISIANYSLDELGFAIFDASVAGAKAARDFADAFGGLEGFAKGISAYVDAFYSDGEKLEIITKRVREALAGIDPNNVNTAINSRGDFKALTDWAGSNAANDASQANLFAKLINAAPLIDQMFSLQEQIDAAANSAGGAGDSLEAVNAALQEREALEQRLLRLQGDTAALRQLEAAALDPSNRALLEQIHLLEDKAEADQIAAKIASERAGIERQILQLQGDTAKLREREVNALDASLRPLMQQVHALQDQAEATNAARLAAEALAAEQEAIANERAGLERTLMQLLGQTAELRNIEMAALHPSNRALKERIWAIEAEQEAAQALAAAEQERASERLALESRLLAAQGDVEAIRLRELNALHPANRAILAQIFSLEDATEARNAEALAAEREAQAIADLATRRADLERELLSLQGDKVALQAMELAALDPTLHALRKRIWALQEEQAATELSAQAARQIASERESLETRLLTLQGKTAELQVRAIAALDPSNRALQRHVFLLEAEAAALDEANRLAAAEADERIRLEVQLLELQGKTAELREREIAALFPANASIKQRIWALQEEAAALEEANRLAAAQADEKYRLETQLLELQGDTAALRSRELALLFPANHELKKRIWALQDAAAAEGGATDALNASTEKMRAALSLVEDLIGKAIDSISTAAQEQIDVLRNQLDAAQAAFDATSARFERSYDVVRASIDAERALTVAGYEAAIGSLDERIRSATAGIDGLSSVVGMLDGALAGRSAIDRAAEVRELAAAQSLLRGQGGRPPADQDQLRKALDVVGGDTARFYTRSEDYTREFLKNSIAIAKMRDNAAAQLSEGERTIAALEAQKEARAAQHDANMAALDRQAEQAEAIYQAALGNTVAIMDVDASISRLSQIAKQFTAEQVALQSLTATTNARIEAIEARADEQIDLLNDQLRAARTQVQIAEGTYAATLSITDAIDELNREVLLFLAAQESETPAAAAGTFGPETGALTASTSEGGPGPAIHLDTREMARELRQMREEFVRINQEMLKLTVQNKEYLKRISTLERINYQDRKKAEAEA